MLTAAKGSTRLRVGVLVDDLQQPAWIRRIVADIQQSDVAEMVLVVKNGLGAQRNDGSLRKVRERPDLVLYWLYQAVDTRLFGQRGPSGLPRIDAKDGRLREDPFFPGDIGPLVRGVPQITVHPRKTRFSDYFTDEDTRTIASFDLDVVLRFGFRILRGDALEIARYGVWSYHHGDNWEYRGGPAGFWEVFDRAPVTGAILQRLTEDLDNGVVLCRSYSSTDRYSVARNRTHYFWTSAAFVMRKLRELHEDGPSALESLDGGEAFRPYSRRMYVRPSNPKMAGLLIRHGATVAAERIQHSVKPSQWVLAYSETYGAPTMHRFKYLVPPEGHSWADPFPLARDGRRYVFFEEDLPSPRGARISVMELDEKGTWSDPEPVLEANYHTSYPFIFEWRDQLYMVPETVEARRVELYRCTEFPRRWEPEAILVDDVAAVDATISEVDGRWWMFVNIAVEGSTDYSELHLYSASAPTGPWRPHRRNPVKSDARSSRPAGRMFWWHGDLIRPAQDCGKRYGFATTFQKVCELNERTFREEEVGRIEPSWDDDLLATHTFNMVPGLTTVDALRCRALWRRNEHGSTR